jgi:hypothetical protein
MKISQVGDFGIPEQSNSGSMTVNWRSVIRSGHFFVRASVPPGDVPHRVRPTVSIIVAEQLRYVESLSRRQPQHHTGRLSFR